MSYEKILKEIIDNAKIEDVFDLQDLQQMQDEFAGSLNIASVITNTDGQPLTKPSNFTCLCADYVRQTEKVKELEEKFEVKRYEDRI